MLRAAILALPLSLLLLPLLPAQDKEKDKGQDKEYAKVWIQIGYKQLQKNELTEAEKCFKKALELDPKSRLAYGNLTVVYTRNKRWPDVITSANTAIRLGIKATTVHLNRAEANRQLAAKEKDKKRQKDYYDQAISDCEKIVNHKESGLEVTGKKDVAYAHAVLSLCYRALGETKLAQKHRETALELEPGLKDQ